MKCNPINPPKNNVAEGTGLNFSDDEMNEAEAIQANDVTDYDEDWEPYDFEDL